MAVLVRASLSVHAEMAERRVEVPEQRSGVLAGPARPHHLDAHCRPSEAPRHPRCDQGNTRRSSKIAMNDRMYSTMVMTKRRSGRCSRRGRSVCVSAHTSTLRRTWLLRRPRLVGPCGASSARAFVSICRAPERPRCAWLCLGRREPRSASCRWDRRHRPRAPGETRPAWRCSA